METVSDDDLDYILDTPDHLKEEMERKYNDYRKKWIIHWLETSPYASWSRLGGRFLLFNEEQALAIIKSFIKTDEGNVYLGRSLLLYVYYRAKG